MTEHTMSRSCEEDEHSRCRGRTDYFEERGVEDGRPFLGAAGSTWQLEQRYRVYSLPSARKLTGCGLPAPQTSHLADREMVKCMVRPILGVYPRCRDRRDVRRNPRRCPQRHARRCRRSRRVGDRPSRPIEQEVMGSCRAVGDPKMDFAWRRPGGGREVRARRLARPLPERASGLWFCTGPATQSRDHRDDGNATKTTPR
jgi:hypothetical protein